MESFHLTKFHIHRVQERFVFLIHRSLKDTENNTSCENTFFHIFYKSYQKCFIKNVLSIAAKNSKNRLNVFGAFATSCFFEMFFITVSKILFD